MGIDELERAIAEYESRDEDWYLGDDEDDGPDFSDEDDEIIGSDEDE